MARAYTNYAERNQFAKDRGYSGYSEMRRERVRIRDEFSEFSKGDKASKSRSPRFASALDNISERERRGEVLTEHEYWNIVREHYGRSKK